MEIVYQKVFDGIECNLVKLGNKLAVEIDGIQVEEIDLLDDESLSCSFLLECILSSNYLLYVSHRNMEEISFD